LFFFERILNNMKIMLKFLNLDLFTGEHRVILGTKRMNSLATGQGKIL